MAYRLVSIFLAALLGCSLAFADDQADAPLPWNGKADKSTCPISSGAVWAGYHSGQDCIRYFAAGNIEHAPVAVIVFGGDRHRAARMKPEEIRDNTVRKQQAIADRVARRLGLPVVIVARPGTYGSSGNHLRTRHIAEFLALNAALDAIKDRYRIERFVVYGHSGGATAGAALLTMGRTDISCAVLTSGAFALFERARILDEAKGRKPRDRENNPRYADLYDPLDHVDGIVRDPTRKIFVIGNEKDQVTPFDLQKMFADKVRQEGHQVQLVTHAAVGPAFHDLKDSIGLTTAASCARPGR